jgi:NADH dehydrogenase
VVNSVAAAKRTGVQRFILISANGIRIPGTAYQETKLRAEQHLAASGLDATILRPSVIFGDPGENMEFATQLYRDMVASPMPAVGFFTGFSPGSGAVLMSPVHVADVAAAVAAVLQHSPGPDPLILGGPDVLSWSEMIRRIAAAVGKSKLIIPMPIALMKLAATLLDRIPAFPVTRDQLTMLAENNIAKPATLEQLIGRSPRAFAAENLTYLKGA